MRFSFERSHLEKIYAKRNGYMILAIGATLICLIQLAVIFF